MRPLLESRHPSLLALHHPQSLLLHRWHTLWQPLLLPPLLPPATIIKIWGSKGCLGGKDWKNFPSDSDMTPHHSWENNWGSSSPSWRWEEASWPLTKLPNAVYVLSSHLCFSKWNAPLRTTGFPRTSCLLHPPSFLPQLMAIPPSVAQVKN